jgi:hypothetical protein
MKTFLIGEKEIRVPTNWEEITLRKYFTIAKLEQSKSSFAFEELYMMKMIEVLCDSSEEEMDDMTLEQVTEISESLQFMSNMDDWKIHTNINIGGVDYVFPKDMNKLTMGEYISIKTLQENTPDTIDTIPLILGIILRPGKKIIDDYGKEKWVQNKFDVEGIEIRKELFMDQPVSNVMGAINFFLNGKNGSMNNIKDSMEKDQEQVV